MNLHFDVHQTGIALTNASEVETAVDEMLFTVLVDDVPVTSFVPTPGLNQTLRLPVPYEVIANTDKNNHEIRFVLQRDDCTNDSQTRIVVHDTSYYPSRV